MQKKCQTCSSIFETRRSAAKFCSRICANRVHGQPRIGHCVIAECGATIHSKRLCNKHYRQHLAVLRMKDCLCGCGWPTSYTFVAGHNTKLLTGEEQRRRARMNDGSALRDTGSADWYRKVRGRHEHRAVMEQHLGRKLTRSEIVHHKDGDKKNNAITNLEVMTQSEHAKLHAAEKRNAVQSA
jgi:hypothetical protein